MPFLPSPPTLRPYYCSPRTTIHSSWDIMGSGMIWVANDGGKPARVSGKVGRGALSVAEEIGQRGRPWAKGK
jgi:hypothetical protein